MKEFTINMRKDGSSVIAKDFWNRTEDFEDMINRPYLFEVGQKIVDIFSNVITIKEIIKYPSIDCKAPQWNILVEENRNTYIYYEIAGIFVKELTKEETEKLLK